MSSEVDPRVAEILGAPPGSSDEEFASAIAERAGLAKPRSDAAVQMFAAIAAAVGSLIDEHGRMPTDQAAAAHFVMSAAALQVGEAAVRQFWSEYDRESERDYSDPVTKFLYEDVVTDLAARGLVRLVP